MIFTASLALSLIVAGANGHSSGDALRNPGFEAAELLEGWNVIASGAKAEIVREEKDVKEGRSALRISSGQPAETELWQELGLLHGGWYRLSGWLKTRDVDPIDATVYATFQIQLAGGRALLATAPNHHRDTGWRTETVIFQAPTDGRVRIAVYFAGSGKGKGTVWFDGLALEPIDPAAATAVITKEPLRPGKIDASQCGQFVEYLCTLIPGMWADKLCDGGFEGPTPYKLAYLKETDNRDRPWYPIGATNRARFEHDTSTKINGDSSYKISATEAIPCTVGIAQDGIAVDRAAPCELSCYLKQDALTGPVRISIHNEDKVYASCEFRPTAEWKRYRVRLLPSATDARATLSFEFRGPGTLWLDAASLMPANAVGGWRRDVVEAVRDMKPAVIRFGGSALDTSKLGQFEWRDTVGDPDRRPPFRAWGGLQPAGAGLEEIVQFCQAVKAEPLICLRIAHKTPQDAADEVHYFNDPVATSFGAQRARNGHPEPYRVRYWQVGNEQGGAEYERRLPEFCRALKQADPAIQIFASYPSPGVIRGAGEWLDFVCPHHYDCSNLAEANDDLNAIRVMIKEHAPGRNIKVAVTEWNTTAGDAGPRRARLWTLENALACSRYQNLLHRQCDLVTIANRSNLVNSFCSGVIQTDSQRLYKTPTYYAQQLYATLAGERPLRIDSSLSPLAAPDLSATLSADGNQVILFAVNDGLAAITRQIDLSAFGKAILPIDVWTLADTKAAGEPDATNSFAEPERVVPLKSTLVESSPRFNYRFPALSLTVLKFHVTGGK